jgi:hypothetical protein
MSKYGAVLFVFAAGLIHLAIVPDHLSHAPIHGLTFLAIGTAQVLWAIAYVRFWRLAIFYWVGLGLSGGIVLLWVLTQLIVPPFAAEPEPVDVATIASKCAEIAAFFALLIFARRFQNFDSLRHVIAGATMITVAVGAGMFFAGHAVELLFPQLTHDHTSPAPAHSSDAAPTHLHEDTLHANLEIGNHGVKVAEASLHTGSDHAHDQAVDASTNPADVHLHDVIGSPASVSQNEIMAAPEHQHATRGPVEAGEASPTEQEASHLSGDHQHDGESANLSTAEAAGAVNQSVAPDTPESHFAADHSHADEATALPDQSSHREIITGLETEPDTAAYPQASEHTMDGSVDETASSPLRSGMTDYHQDQMSAAGSLESDPAFDSGISRRHMPQFQPNPGYPVLGYPSIQDSPEQLRMFRNRWNSVWSSELPLIQTQPGW